MNKHFIERTAEFLVQKRRVAGFFTLAAAILCAVLIPRVPINSDMTEYLPSSSSMKQGIDIMAEEFPEMSYPSTVRVMFTGLEDEEKNEIKKSLSSIEYVDSVSYGPLDPHSEDGTHSLYTLSTGYGYKSSQMNSIRRQLKQNYKNYTMTFSVDDPGGELPMWIIVLAVILVVALLLVMSASWVEPLIALSSIGVAIVLSIGSSFFLGGMSDTTWSVAAILQLILSLDYSVILMNRYRQEKQSDPSISREKAMSSALVNAFSAISSSSLTTIAGMLSLVFMSFRIGRDMGFVLAKGVLCSMICIFTLLPMLILWMDPVIERTPKKQPSPDLSPLARLQYRMRYPIFAVLLILFFTVLFLKGSTPIAYSINPTGEIDRVFPAINQIVVLYSNDDEDNAAKIASSLQKEQDVESVSAWSTTLGKAFTAKELKELLPSFTASMGINIPDAAVDLLYLGASGSTSDKADPAAEKTMTINDLLSTAKNLLKNGSLLSSLLGQEVLSLLDDADTLVADAGKQMHGEHYSLMAVSTTLPVESEQTWSFLDSLDQELASTLGQPYYLIGNSPMGWEMSKTFGSELTRITLLTAAAVFLVVLITFRSFFIPTLLVLLIQTAVFATMVIIHLQGSAIYYLALLVVQSILMGATIDYAILFTTYYRELRRSHDIPETLAGSYNGSINTILTSGSIMILATIVLGYAFTNPAIGQICLTISKGACCSVILILFILPGALAALDRFVS